MRIGVAGCVHESNTFAPGKTTLDQFQSDWIVGKEAFYHSYSQTSTSMGGVIEEAEREGFELVPTFYTQAVPSGIVAEEAIENIITTLINEIDKVADTLDGLVLILHGAMVGEGYQDVEGEILKRVRQTLPSMPIAITLDLHANVSDEMVDCSDIIVGYDTYPHIDMKERAEEACRLLTSYIRKEIQPVHQMERPNLLIDPSAMDTNNEPMKTLIEKAFDYEKDPEVLNIVIAGGFPYSDVSSAGASITVTTDGNKKKAQQIAQELTSWMWENRDQFRSQCIPVDQALKLTDSMNKYPTIFVESSDNVGGGSPADATHVLQSLLAHRQERFLIVISDPEAVKHAENIGVKGVFSFEVGGKTDKLYGQSHLHGEPVLIKGKVRLLSDGEFVHHGPHKTGLRASMGKTAVIALDDCPYSIVVLTEKRVSPRDINQTRSIGIVAEDFKIIVVKAAIAWKTAFGELANNVIEIDTPGCCSMNLNNFNYKNIPNHTHILGREELPAI